MQTLRTALLIATAPAALAAASQAGAQTAGTLAGTVVSNTAQASFTVNGAAQTATSNTQTFVVDRKVNLTVVAATTAATPVTLGQSGAVAAFRVTNNTNGTQDFILAATQVVPAGILTGTNNYALGNLKVFVDGNGNGVYDPATDTGTWIDELAPDASATVFVVGDVPNQQNADRAFVAFDASTAAGGAPGTKGALVVATDGAALDQQNAVDVVFADDDNDGTLGYDTARNGSGWAYAAFAVSTNSVGLTVVKSASVLSDGVSALNPKALPGAVIQYCLTVSNPALTTAASNVTLTDVIPANTSYVPGSINVGGVGTAGVCLVGGLAVADNGATTTPYGGSYNGATKTVTAIIPTLPGGTSLAASFRVTVN